MSRATNLFTKEKNMCVGSLWQLESSLFVWPGHWTAIAKDGFFIKREDIFTIIHHERNVHNCGFYVILTSKGIFWTSTPWIKASVFEKVI